MKILITGASGFIGQHLQSALKKTPHYKLLTPSHKVINFNHYRHIEDWTLLTEQVDVVINTVGIINQSKSQRFSQLHSKTPIALFSACALSNTRVIQISALGADENAFTPYLESKYQADQFLRKLDINSCILRPSLIYGEGGKSFSLFKRLAALPIIPLPDAGKFNIQPVHINDVVDTVLTCLKNNPKKMTIDVVGPRSMTLAEFLKNIRSALNKPPARIISIPSKLIFSPYAQRLFPMLHKDNLRMLQQGNIADPAPLAQLLKRSPLDISEALANTKGEPSCIPS